MQVLYALKQEGAISSMVMGYFSIPSETPLPMASFSPESNLACKVLGNREEAGSEHYCGRSCTGSTGGDDVV